MSTGWINIHVNGKDIDFSVAVGEKELPMKEILMKSGAGDRSHFSMKISIPPITIESAGSPITTLRFSSFAPVIL